MTHRPLEEIFLSIKQANAVDDTTEMFRYAAELDALNLGEADALAAGTRGWAHVVLGDVEVALQCFHNALALYETLEDRTYEVYVLSHIGTVYNVIGQYAKALEYYHRALSHYLESENSGGAAAVTSNIGTVYHTTGDYPTALEHYYRALALHEQVGSQSNVARTTGNIGVIQFRMGNYASAMEHHQRALALNEELGNRSGMAVTINNIGDVHRATGDLETAMQYHQRALTLYEELGERTGVATAMGDLVADLIDSGRYEEAEQMLSNLDAAQIDEPNILIVWEQQRAAIQEHAGDLQAANATLLAALEIAREHSLSSEQAELHKLLRDLALKNNDLAGYVEHNTEFLRINEEVNGKEALLKLAMQDTERRIMTERREHEKHLAVLHSTLPKHVADRVARGEAVNDHYDNASVIFLDIVGFTTISNQLSSEQVVRLLDQVFTTLDAVCEKHDVVKIKTIGDSYMAVAFPRSSASPRTDSLYTSHECEEDSIVVRAANAALDMLDAVSKPITEYLPDIHEVLLEDLRAALPEGIRVRLGVHIGTVTAGVLGKERLQYDVWGDTVNVASRMESTGEAGRIHVSDVFASMLTSPPSPLLCKKASPVLYVAFLMCLDGRQSCRQIRNGCSSFYQRSCARLAASSYQKAETQSLNNGHCKQAAGGSKQVSAKDSNANIMIRTKPMGYRVVEI